MINIMFVVLLTFASCVQANYWKNYGESIGDYWAQKGQEIGDYYANKYGGCEYDDEAPEISRKQARRMRKDAKKADRHSTRIGFGPSFKHSVRTSKKRGGPESGVYYGPAFLHNRTIDKITVYGPAKAENVTVNKSLTVHGPLTADTLTAKRPAQIIVLGPIDLEKCTIDTLKVYTQNASVTDSTIGSLKIKDEKSRPATIYVDGKTSIDSISFKSGKGTVTAKADANVKVGSISGGVLKKRK